MKKNDRIVIKVFEKIFFIFTFLLIFFSPPVYGQIQIESSYMATSKYRDDNNTATGGKGDFKDIGLYVQIPVYIKTNELNQPTAWAIALSGVYASMDNTNLSNDQCLSRLLNSTLGVAHMRPLSEKWMLMASLGAGIYTDLSPFSANTIMGQAGALFIRQRVLTNLDLGIGIALNNVLGYPMLFPALYLDWKTGKRFEFKISLNDTWIASAGMKLNDLFTLRLVAQAKGMSAIVNRNNESKMFIKQLAITGLQQEIYVSKIFSIPVLAGVSIVREAYFQNRTLKSIFHTEENYPHFTTSFYASIGLKFFFNE
jgi:hypothetical protein